MAISESSVTCPGPRFNAPPPLNYNASSISDSSIYLWKNSNFPPAASPINAPHMHPYSKV